MEIKRGIILLFLLIILPLISANIVINQQPNSIYNLGDVVTIPITIKPSADTTGILQMNLLCNGQETNFYKNGVSLVSGEEKNIESSLILEKSIIGEAKGDCKIKVILGTDYVLTNGFLISDLITIDSNISKAEFSPEESIIVKGKAVKENGEDVNGYLDLRMIDGNSTVIEQQGTVNNGLFSVNITIPKDMKSGDYLIELTVHEEDLSGTITNNGVLDKSIFVKQVPTSLEIVFENSEIEPGSNVRVEVVLHDQTGVSIPSPTFLTIKDNNNKIMDQREISTEEFLDFPIAYNEKPSSWKVVAVSNKLTAESKFQILEKESVSVEIINKTVLITNTGNVPYNKTVVVKVGDQALNIDVYLKVDQHQSWILKAPDGNYDIEITAGEQKTSASGIALTGDVIDIRKASASVGSLIRFPLVWIFILAILGFVTFIVFKRGYQKSFIGYISSSMQKKREAREIAAYNPRSRAELSLSIKGEQQDVSMVTLNVKNMNAIKNSKEGGAPEILKKVIDMAEDHKAATYEDRDTIFFIFAPIRTKTFRNEENALRVSQRVKEILEEHNKIFKQRVDFGVSLNYGTIIAKQETNSFKFMGLGSFMTQSKKIASAAENDVLMGEKMKDKLAPIVKTERHKRDGIDVYVIKQIKDHEKHQQFIQGFMKRQEKGQ